MLKIHSKKINAWRENGYNIDLLSNNCSRSTIMNVSSESFNDSCYHPRGLSDRFLCTTFEATHRVTVFTTRCYASAVLAMGLCPSVCHKSVFYRNGWTNRAGFGMWASFHPFYAVLKGNSVISKNKGTSLWNFVLNSGLRKFRHGIWSSKCVINLAEKGGRSERDKLGRRRSTKSIIPPSSNARPL